MLGRIVLAVPCLYLSYALISVWRAPLEWSGGSWVPFGVGLLLVEFLILHSSAFIVHITSTIEAGWKRLKLVLGLACFYGLMALGFALATDSPSLLLVLAGVMLSRLYATWTADPASVEQHKARSAFGIVIYMAAAAGSIFLPLPELGITQAVANEVYPSRGSGVWEREPHRAIAAGAFYFGVLGLAELFLKFDRSRVRS